MANISSVKRIRGAMLGMACGDAVGTTVEFRPPGSFPRVTDMTGGGPFNLVAGQWTDDTSMGLCLAESLIEAGKFDPVDQMERYCRWNTHGHLSSNGDCFDIGNTTASSLYVFGRDRINPYCGPTGEDTAGNGSLMRLCAAPLVYWHIPAAAIYASGLSSRTTHGAPQAVDACRYFAGLLVGCMNNLWKDEILSPCYSPIEGYWEKNQMHPEVRQVANGSYKDAGPPVIKGTGYVVKTLEAALWAFYHTDNFKDGCLMVVNLGDDADTTAAVYGQIAGAYYGEDFIPKEWRKKCALAPLIRLMADEIDSIAKFHKTHPLAAPLDETPGYNAPELDDLEAKALEDAAKAFDGIESSGDTAAEVEGPSEVMPAEEEKTSEDVPPEDEKSGEDMATEDKTGPATPVTDDIRVKPKPPRKESLPTLSAKYVHLKCVGYDFLESEVRESSRCRSHRERREMIKRHYATLDEDAQNADMLASVLAMW